MLKTMFNNLGRLSICFGAYPPPKHHRSLPVEVGTFELCTVEYCRKSHYNGYVKYEFNI